ncbi:class I SAM-dependent methyltransferase [Comamonas aquatica]|uniref:class I SAM-dependent methyltransferase n=1 Tax=Comamonas aquatica TaxID=225991 RepID=UPI0022DDDAB9|nr:class I SAM-dependent methyltransferase [Comamonas aquatica]MDH1903205.1 class I SAM-dependent methyltransferase [Comamonas aquatica]WBM42973.1 class I SAM-dependent methyltransferase [Comamonas aquatica]
MTCSPHAAAVTAAPSAWVQRFAHLLPAGAQVLDLACGSGRHARWLATQGHAVTGVDRDAHALAALPPEVDTLFADLENAPWPLPDRRFDAVVVTNYLWRPLWPQVLASVRPGGVLLYETFAQGNAAYGKPLRPDFLLSPGELLQVCAGWTVVAYEHGLLRQPERVVQRVAAIAPGLTASPPVALYA